MEVFEEIFVKIAQRKGMEKLVSINIRVFRGESFIILRYTISDGRQLA